MSLFNEMMEKPILRQFKQAAKLANEWRDTLLYAGLAAYAVYSGMAEGDVNYRTISSIFWGREISRYCAWNIPSKEYAGFTEKKTDERKMRLSALFMMCADCAMDCGVSYSSGLAPSALFIGAFDLGLAASCAYLVGGVKGVFRAYGETMFDYPRKKGGGGTTQTQKLVNGVKKLLGRTQASPIAVPSPS